MRNFEGTLRVRLHADKGITLERGVKESTLTAADVGQIATIMVEAATKHKVGIDRWSLYIPEINEKLSKDDKTLPVAKVVAALNNPGNEVTLVAARFGLPKVVVAPKVTTIKKASKYIDIA
jgi:hypothetical protein